LSHAHGNDEGVVALGTGLDLAEPLKFSHAANLPFSNRGTGITFEPASAFPHASNEPIQALGTGITLDRPLSLEHAINAVVRDTSVTSAGYQGKPGPNQWFGGPELVTRSPQFGRTITAREGSLVLRDGHGLVVDSVNYGGLVDPWAAEAEQSGCRAPAPGPAGGFGTPVGLTADSSAGRFPDGADTDSNCDDFFTQATANLSADSAVGATNIKVSRVEGFHPGTTIAVGSGASLERAVIATVGTAGATTSNAAIPAGATIIPVANANGFALGETVTLDKGSNMETVVIASIHRFGDSSIVAKTPLTLGHSAGVAISGSGITLSNALTRSHEGGAQITDDIPTPGRANHYSHE
jgi:non-reducing end alpha-L-arabinofuranosidase